MPFILYIFFVLCFELRELGKLCCIFFFFVCVLFC